MNHVENIDVQLTDNLPTYKNNKNIAMEMITEEQRENCMLLFEKF